MALFSAEQNQAALMKLHDLLDMLEGHTGNDDFDIVPFTEVEYYEVEIRRLMVVAQSEALDLAQQLAYAVGKYTNMKVEPTAASIAFLKGLRDNEVPPRLVMVVCVLIGTSHDLVASTLAASPTSRRSIYQLLRK